MPVEKESRRILVSPGQTVRLFFEQGGSIVDIKSNPSLTTPFSLEQKSLNPREETRERLKAEYPDILFKYGQTRLDERATKTVGGEREGSEMNAFDARIALNNWIENAKNAGISDKDMEGLAKSLLNNYTFDRNVLRGIVFEVQAAIAEAFRARRKKK